MKGCILSIVVMGTSLFMVGQNEVNQDSLYTIILWSTDSINENKDISFLFYENRADAYGELGRWDQAIIDYSKYLEVACVPDVLYKKVLACYFNLDFEEGLLSVEKLIQNEGEQVDYLFIQAVFNRRLGNYELALRQFDHLIELYPTREFYAISNENRDLMLKKIVQGIS